MKPVSVIIPAYNVEAYIDECVKSVLEQSYTALEVVLVDDGATDQSGAKCDKWAQKDARVKAVHKENGGLSDARNVGLQHATGEYVLFLDSDDYWDDPDALKKLMARIEITQADVLNFSLKKYYEDTQEKQLYFKDAKPMPLGLAKAEQYAYLAKHGLFIACAWNKLIKKALLDNEGISFRKGVFSEDIEWCAKLLTKAERMDFLPESFCCYRQRSGSITHSIDDKKCRDLRDNLLRCFELFESVSKEIQPLAYRYTAYLFGTFFMTQALAKTPQTECIESLRPYRWILRYHGGDKKVRLLYYCCNVIGYKNTCRLMRLLYHKGE